MTSVLLFLLIIAVTSGWWLSHQRLTSKPWLESGPKDVLAGTDRVQIPKAKLGLVVFLAVIGMFFSLFFSGHFMRQELADWRALPLPRILVLNSALLVLASVYLQSALIAARRNDGRVVKNMLSFAGLSTLGFLLGQLTAWQQLVGVGFAFANNPANSFFYLLTGLHGAHLLGGGVALAYVVFAAWGGETAAELMPKVDLCALYWHFLLVV